MILECPNCDTNYEIPVELPPEGRKVRCVSCQHIWQAMPASENPEAGDAPETVIPEAASEEVSQAPLQDTAADNEPAGPDEAADGGEKADLSVLNEFNDEEITFKDEEPVAEPAPKPESGSEPEPEVPAAVVEAAPAELDTSADQMSDTEMADAFSAAIAEAGMSDDIEETESPPIVIGKARKKTKMSLPVNLAAGWAALALVLTGILSIGYFQRVKVVQLLPGAAQTYARLGLPVNIRGLAFKDVKYSWETSAGRPVLEVIGTIENVTSHPMKVPTVVFGLRTKEKVEVYQWAADVRADLLPPGEDAAFSAQIPTPPKSIRDVQVRFAKIQ